MVDRSLSLGVPDRLVACQGCAGQQHGVPRGRRLPSADEAVSPLGTSVCTRSRARLGSARERQQQAPNIGMPGQAGARIATAGPGYRGRRISGTGDGRARTGAVCGPDGPRPGPWPRVAGVTLAGACGHRVRIAACCRSRQRRDGPGNSSCGPVQASLTSAETVAGALWSPAAGNRGLCSRQAHNEHRSS